jgi:hypothetical protein
VPEDWRLTVTVSEPELTARLRRVLEDHSEANPLAGRIAVSGDAQHVFIYAGRPEDAHAAETILRSAAGDDRDRISTTIDRWHPVEERWEDEQVPLPQTEEELTREQARREADERELSEELGEALWEVRVELESHHAADELARRLTAEGWGVTRRWRYLLVGAANEEEAQALAERLEREEPAARVHPEPSGALVWQLLGRTPFAFLNT